MGWHSVLEYHSLLIHEVDIHLFSDRFTHPCLFRRWRVIILPLTRLFFSFGIVHVEPGFIHGDDTSHEIITFLFERFRNFVDAHTLLDVFSSVIRLGIHRAHSFFIFKFSIKIRCTAPYDMPVVSQISLTLTRRSAYTTSRTESINVEPIFMALSLLHTYTYM